MFNCSFKTCLETVLYTFMCIYMWISITGNDGVIFWRGSQGTGKFTEQEDFKKYLWGKIVNKYGKIFEKNIYLSRRSELIENLESRKNNLIISFCFPPFLDKEQLRLFQLIERKHSWVPGL